MGFADYPFQSHFLEISGHRMHYVDEGSGPVLLFLHGNPTSSYLWRNVIKPLRGHFRCIAPDLMGFGHSDKPDIDYRFLTHYGYLEALVEALELRDITLVLHDWGGPLGFRLAQHQPERVRAICFMEAFPFTLEWNELPWLMRPLFLAFRTEPLGRLLVMRQNLFLNLVLPRGVLRPLPRSVKAAYRAPFRNWRDRYPILVWPNELPLEDRKGETWRAICQIEDNLPEMAQPMLLLTFHPGVLIPPVRAHWLRERIADLEIIDCGRGLHFVQEDQPGRIADTLEQWLYRRGLARHRASGGALARGTQNTRLHESEALREPVQWTLAREDGCPLLLAWSRQGLVMRSWLHHDEDPESVLRREFPRATPEQIAPEEAPGADDATPLHLVGTPFQRRVWKALREIPAGQTSSYRELAVKLNTAPRALGQAVARNRIAEYIPCHRVVPAEGGTGSYRWGVDRKKQLLEREGAVVGKKTRSR